MEIKHGRIAMAAVTHVLLTVNGVRWPGYLSYAEDIKSQRACSCFPLAGKLFQRPSSARLAPS